MKRALALSRWMMICASVARSGRDVQVKAVMTTGRRMSPRRSSTDTPRCWPAISKTKRRAKKGDKLRGSLDRPDDGGRCAPGQTKIDEKA